MRHISAVFLKQIRDTAKNKAILIQFVLFPAMTLLMDNMVRIEGMPENFFVNLFASMYVGMAPMTCMAAVIAEEKEKNTLRVLLMSHVRPAEYLVGTGGAVWLAAMAGAGVIGLCGHYTGARAAGFMLLMAAGILISVLIGAAIGVWSKNQIMETSVTVPVMVVFSFLPMLGMFNKAMAQAARLTYSGQIQSVLWKLSGNPVMAESQVIAESQVMAENWVTMGNRAVEEVAAVMLLSAVAAAAVFLWGYRKGGMD